MVKFHPSLVALLATLPFVNATTMSGAPAIANLLEAHGEKDVLWFFQYHRT
jgi:hypothetical protein